VVAATVAATGGLMSILLHGGQPPGNPNNWAILPLTGLLSVCLGFPVAVAGSRGRLTLGLLAILNLAVLNVTWVFLSASRGVSLIALVSVAYLILAIRGMPRRMAIFLVGASMALAVGTQFPELQARLRERVAQSFDPAYEISTRTSGRSDLMLAGWHMFKRSPFGVGTGGFASAWASLGDLRGELAFDRRIGLETQAHAGWIKILAENGIVGFLLLAAYVASFTFIGLRKSGENKDLRLLGIMVSGVLLVAFTAREFYDKGLWFLAAGATALLHGLDLRTRPAAKVYSPISERSDVVPRPPA
jgi:hypothetical protein